MKRRSFLIGAAAAPAFISVADLLGLVSAQTAPAESPELAYTPMRGASLYIDGHPIDGLLSFTICEAPRDVIEVTSLLSTHRTYRPTGYASFSADLAVSDPSVHVYLHEAFTDMNELSFDVVIGPAKYSFTGYLERTDLHVHPRDNITLSIDVRANSVAALSAA